MRLNVGKNRYMFAIGFAGHCKDSVKLAMPVKNSFNQILDFIGMG